jgi:hypothetical protein
MATRNTLWLKSSTETRLNVLGSKLRLWTSKAIFQKQYRPLDIEEEDDKTAPNPFTDPHVAELWQLKYEKSQYECRHFFDKNIVWTRAEEKQVVRRLDRSICLWAVS